MYNYQIIVSEDNNIFFISTNANKATVRELFSLYYLEKMGELNYERIIRFFNSNDYELTFLPTKKHSLYNFISSLNYQVIALSNITNET